MNIKRALILSVLAAMVLPGLVLAQTTTRATFEVTKDFLDGNDETEVTVSIGCNTGQILDQDKILADGDTVIFVVTSFNSGELNCSIEESGTDGYSAEYVGNGILGGCEWEDITDGTEGLCTIENTPKPVDIKVTKAWNTVGDNNDVDLGYTLRVWCDKIFDEEDEPFLIGSYTGKGPGSITRTFTVRPVFKNSSCWVQESGTDSAVEVDNGCGSKSSPFKVSAGKGASCTITNTVFFEGIPTLSQYGMAIMALLMLGVGFVGFRRFV